MQMIEVLYANVVQGTGEALGELLGELVELAGLCDGELRLRMQAQNELVGKNGCW